MPEAKLAVLLAARSVSAPCLNAPRAGGCRQSAVCLCLPDFLPGSDSETRLERGLGVNIGVQYWQVQRDLFIITKEVEGRAGSHISRGLG